MQAQSLWGSTRSCPARKCRPSRSKASRAASAAAPRTQTANVRGPAGPREGTSVPRGRQLSACPCFTSHTRRPAPLLHVAVNWCPTHDADCIIGTISMPSLPAGGCSLLYEESIAKVNSIAVLASGPGMRVVAGAVGGCRLSVPEMPAQLPPATHQQPPSVLTCCPGSAAPLQASPSSPTPTPRSPATASTWGRRCSALTTCGPTAAPTRCAQTTAACWALSNTWQTAAGCTPTAAASHSGSRRISTPPAAPQTAQECSRALGRTAASTRGE